MCDTASCTDHSAGSVAVTVTASHAGVKAAAAHTLPTTFDQSSAPRAPPGSLPAPTRAQPFSTYTSLQLLQQQQQSQGSGYGMGATQGAHAAVGFANQQQQRAPSARLHQGSHQTPRAAGEATEKGPISPAAALRRYSEYLTAYEQSEVLQYPQVTRACRGCSVFLSCMWCSSGRETTCPSLMKHPAHCKEHMGRVCLLIAWVGGWCLGLRQTGAGLVDATGLASDPYMSLKIERGGGKLFVRACCWCVLVDERLPSGAQVPWACVLQEASTVRSHKNLNNGARIVLEFGITTKTFIDTHIFTMIS